MKDAIKIIRWTMSINDRNDDLDAIGDLEVRFKIRF